MTQTLPERETCERRHFCRIEDEVILHVRPAPPPNGEAAPPESDASPETFALFSQLTRQRDHVRSLLRELRSESPNVARCLAAIEERLALLEAALLLDQLSGFAGLRRRVKLSAGGMSFRSATQYSPDALLLLEMILLPTMTGIISHCRVLRSTRHLDRDGEPPYLTAVEFVDMKESTRDLIARHVLTQQMQRHR